MPKTLAPAGLSVGETRYTLNAMPDPYDERDFRYQPRLSPLPSQLMAGQLQRRVFDQEGNSCTGQAVAAVINHIHALENEKDAGDRPVISPYMLYRLGRRYDEFEGERDIGSSLRGVLKGWLRHGAAIESAWPKLDMEVEPELDDPALQAARTPLGAFYRVNPFRIDDMQSAVSELQGIVASAMIHKGWETPVQEAGSGKHRIERAAQAEGIGGHAFAIVGYDAQGFLVQNSWGKDWGTDGFAYLSYADWLKCAYDAWVLRPGVPIDGLPGDFEFSGGATGGVYSLQQGLDRDRLPRHVVNLGNNGRLHGYGKQASSPIQIHRIFEDHMGPWHAASRSHRPGGKRHIVLYAHGGMTSQDRGVERADSHCGWWLANGVYPIYFAWQTGGAETFLSSLADLVRGQQPAGGIGFDFKEHFDQLVERVARRFRFIWDEMKENAALASSPIRDPDRIEWPPRSSAAREAMAEMPGASLVVDQLQRYVQAHGLDKVALHLVGHSAGAIFLAEMLDRLEAAGLHVSSMSDMASGMRRSQFERQVLPRIGSGKLVRQHASFIMEDALELDDHVSVRGLRLYHKSLLYLVSRAVERASDAFEVPLVGMERHHGQVRPGQRSFRRRLEDAGADVVTSREVGLGAMQVLPPTQRCASTSHHRFDDDAHTMDAILLRMLGKDDVSLIRSYEEGLPLSAGDVSV